jgi:hypothetical protein
MRVSHIPWNMPSKRWEIEERVSVLDPIKGCTKKLHSCQIYDCIYVKKAKLIRKEKGFGT